ncbi:unnamed protein product [Ectocarpus sp. CCAP 1310/34]|nr:unnamed protein product [Ectocarpus sp. CCAP 1310/34]
MEKAINRLLSKRKQRENDRPIPEDLAVVASKEQLEQDLGRAARLELKRQGLMIEGLRVKTVFLGGLTRLSKRSKIFASVRAGGGKPEGGLLRNAQRQGQRGRPIDQAKQVVGKAAGEEAGGAAGEPEGEAQGGVGGEAREGVEGGERRVWGVGKAVHGRRLGGAVVVGVRKGETGVARDRVAGAAPLVLASKDAERGGGSLGSAAAAASPYFFSRTATDPDNNR